MAKRSKGNRQVTSSSRFAFFKARKEITMEWIPVGPDFVFRPRAPFTRLSRRNEFGHHGPVFQIVEDAQRRLYVRVDATFWGTAAFRSDDLGRSWVPLADDLVRADPTVRPTALALNPQVRATVYLAAPRDNFFARATPGRAGRPADPCRAGCRTWSSIPATPTRIRPSFTREPTPAAYITPSTKARPGTRPT